MRRIASIALLALAVFGSQACTGSLAYACEMDQVVHRSCCCEGNSAKAQDSTRQVRDYGCCELKVVESAPAFGSAPATAVSAPLQISTLIHADTANTSRDRFVASNFDVATRGPTSAPIFLTHCSLLI